MPKFHTLKVQDIRQETADCVSVAFAVPKTLAADYQFIQGQYLTLKTSINGEEIRRSYSICVGPKDGELRVAIKKVPDGRFSTYANEVLKVGEELEVMTPMGKFYTPLNANNQKQYVFFAAGSGITPTISIIKAILAEEPKSQVSLFYGNKGVGTIIFKEEIEQLKNLYLGRLSIHHILSQEMQGSDIFCGRLDGNKCTQYANIFFDAKTVDAYFICGPGDMIFSLKEALEKMGVELAKIHFELFVSPDQKNIPTSQAKEATTSNTKNIESQITIILDGNTYEFPLDSKGENILDTALKNGADLPFACKGGVCCTCKAKIMTGEVTMDVNYGLEADEIARGFVLTCQSHPTTDKVVVNFDES